MPRSLVSGQSLNIAGSIQKASWGNTFLTTDPITCAFLFKPTANGSSNYDVVWGHGTASWFFILQGVSTKLAFHFITSGGEKGTAGLTNNLTIGTWYLIVGTHDSAGGANNTSLAAYTASDGVLVERLTSTDAYTISTTVNSLVAGYDSTRTLTVNARFKNFMIWNRVLSTGEQDSLATNTAVSRTSLLLETLCNDSSITTLKNSAASTPSATLSGSATLVGDVPTPFAGTRTTAGSRNVSQYTGVFGNNAIGGFTSTIGVNRYLMGKFTINGTVTVQSISIYGNSAAGTIGCDVLIYSDVAGTPVVRKAVKQNNVTTALQWSTLTFTTPVTLPAGTYWLGMIFSNTFNYYYTATGGMSINTFVNSSYVNQGSNPYNGSGGGGTLYLSIYANYTTTGRTVAT